MSASAAAAAPRVLGPGEPLARLDAALDGASGRVAGVALGRGELLVTVGHDPAIEGAVAALHDAEWDGRLRLWRVPAHEAQLTELAGIVRALGLPTTPEAREALDAAWERSEEMLEASRAEAAELQIEGLGGTLRPFQRAGVAYALRARRCLIGDQMGLGKTVQALACLEAVGEWPAVIVCPASLKINWQREAERWLPARSVAVLEGTRTQQLTLALLAEVIILNYDILHAWLDVLPRPRAVVLDESHCCKSSRARRTKAAVMLAEQVPPDGLVLLLTGTPILNRPEEVISQLSIMGRLQAFGGREAFRQRYCRPRLQRITSKRTGRTITRTICDGADHLDELQRKLRRTCMVRRTKAQVLPELPPKVRTTLWMPGDPKVLKEYRQAEADLIAYLAQRARQVAFETGHDPAQAVQTTIWKAQAAEHLVRVNQLRQLVAKAKLKDACAWLEGVTEPVVVFVHHRAIGQALVERFRCPAIASGMTTGERQRSVDAFQAGEADRIVCSIQAAGVGLTLHRASDLLMVEQAWTPAVLEQAEDRCHRIGQTGSVTAWYAAIADTIDETIFELLRAKRQIIEAATDTLPGAPITNDLIQALAVRGLS